MSQVKECYVVSVKVIHVTPDIPVPGGTIGIFDTEKEAENFIGYITDIGYEVSELFYCSTCDKVLTASDEHENCE